MLILNEHNRTDDTDQRNYEGYYSVLSFRNPKNPDFFFDRLTQIDEFVSASVAMEIGPYRLVMPYHWSILCTDREYVQAIQLFEIVGGLNEVFCINPIDGYVPHFLRLRLRQPFRDTGWTAPPIDDKSMLVVPLGPSPTEGRGPLCAIFTPKHMETERPISDIL